MSESSGNIINLFLSDTELHKQIMKIQTDYTPLENPKNPDTCNLFTLYKLIASHSQITEIGANYEGRNYGYGTAKQAFYELLVTKYAVERERYNYYITHLEEVGKALEIGAEKARKVAFEVLIKSAGKIGLLIICIGVNTCICNR